jgi:DNA-binding NarL/FixJ family response regulator
MPTRILIADDHEVMRSVLRHLLDSHEGWQVCSEAKNGGEAVAKAADLRPDVIVLDLAMPIMDGVQAAREILKSRPEAVVVMFTLHSSEQLERTAAQVGVKRVISKAHNGSRLLSAIEEVLAERRSQSASGSGQIH